MYYKTSKYIKYHCTLLHAYTIVSKFTVLENINVNTI